MKFFPADLQSVISTPMLFLKQAFAESKSLHTFAARKRSSGCSKREVENGFEKEKREEDNPALRLQKIKKKSFGK